MKNALALLTLVVAWALVGYSAGAEVDGVAAAETVTAAGLEAGSKVFDYLDLARGVMAWVVDNQTLVVGFLAALAAIYGGAQKLNRRRNRDAMDGVVEMAPAAMLSSVADRLTPSARQKLERSINRTKKVR